MDNLIPGRRLHVVLCTLCNTVTHRAPQWEAAFTGRVLMVWPSRQPFAPPALDIEAPPVVVDWCDRFDRGMDGAEYAIAA